MTDLVPVRRALISLSDKSGLEDLFFRLTSNDAASGVPRVNVISSV